MEGQHPWHINTKQQQQTQTQADTTTLAAGTPATHKLPPFPQSVTLTSLMRSMVNKAANLIG